MSASTAPTADRPSISFALTLLLAFCTGTIVANLYYAQPLVGLIGAALHLPDWAVGLVVTLIQIGYGVGLAFVVPLGDLVENRKLIVATLIFNALSLLGLTLTTSVPAFFAFAFLVGVTTTSVQMIIPLAAHLAPARQRGAVVGNVMSGLLMGLMLSRPTASCLAQ
jgi:MFS family permease